MRLKIEVYPRNAQMIGSNCLTTNMGSLDTWKEVGKFGRDKWVPVTTAWRVLRLRMEERPPVWRVAATIIIIIIYLIFQISTTMDTELVNRLR
jgi:hypothetical protein